MKEKLTAAPLLVKIGAVLVKPTLQSLRKIA